MTKSGTCVWEAPVMEAMGMQQVIGMGKRGIPGHME